MSAHTENQEFDFLLPEQLIALRPARPRHSARLLVVHGNSGPIENARISDLPWILKSGDALVINNSRVMRLALDATRPPRTDSGKPVAVSLLMHSQISSRRWKALARPARRLQPGDRLRISNTIDCTVCTLNGPEIIVEMEQDTNSWNLESLGHMPLPPYIARRRAPDHLDDSDYQTRFASVRGSIAAPTAGLHFTDTLTENLTAAGISLLPITLHTGCATFAPASSDNTLEGKPPPENCTVPERTAHSLNRLRSSGGRCIAVGTTALRTLHTAWNNGQLNPFNGNTNLFITPGFTFEATDALLTNFHLPRSSLFALVCAMMGTTRMQQVYKYAINQQYRFYSYGDACLLLPDHGRL